MAVTTVQAVGLGGGGIGAVVKAEQATAALCPALPM